MLDIVLVEPEIPNNTGAIARTCAERSQIPARLHEARVAAVKARERRKENGPVALSSPTAKDA